MNTLRASSVALRGKTIRFFESEPSVLAQTIRISINDYQK